MLPFIRVSRAKTLLGCHHLHASEHALPKAAIILHVEFLLAGFLAEKF